MTSIYCLTQNYQSPIAPIANCSPARRAAAFSISDQQIAICNSSVCDVRNQRNLAGALERRLQLALVHRTRARDPARQDLPALRHEGAQQLDVLVVDVVDLVRAELADFAAAEHRPAL